MLKVLKAIFDALVPLREVVVEVPPLKSEAEMYDEQTPRWRYRELHQHVNQQSLQNLLREGWEPFQINDTGWVVVKRYC